MMKRLRKSDRPSGGGSDRNVQQRPFESYSPSKMGKLLTSEEQGMTSMNMMPLMGNGSNPYYNGQLKMFIAPTTTQMSSSSPEAGAVPMSSSSLGGSMPVPPPLPATSPQQVNGPQAPPPLVTSPQTSPLTPSPPTTKRANFLQQPPAYSAEPFTFTPNVQNALNSKPVTYVYSGIADDPALKSPSSLRGKKLVPTCTITSREMPDAFSPIGEQINVFPFTASDSKEAARQEIYLSTQQSSPSPTKAGSGKRKARSPEGNVPSTTTAVAGPSTAGNGTQQSPTSNGTNNGTSSNLPSTSGASPGTQEDGQAEATTSVSSTNGEDSSEKKARVVPDEQKDEAYWMKRAKNNESAKRSREARRRKEMQIGYQVVLLEQQNIRLRTELALTMANVRNLHAEEQRYRPYLEAEANQLNGQNPPQAHGQMPPPPPGPDNGNPSPQHLQLPSPRPHQPQPRPHQPQARPRQPQPHAPQSRPGDPRGSAPSQGNGPSM